MCFPTMNLLLRTLLFTLLCVLFATSARGDHLLKGIVEFDGQFQSQEGNVPYRSVVSLRQTVVCWEDLQAEGLRISSCTSRAMQVKGKIDIADFRKDIVLAIPRDDYLKVGCPEPPVTRPDTDPQHQPIIFRRIRQVFLRGHTVDVKTTFLDVAKVVRKIRVEFTPLSATGRQSMSNQSASTLTTTEEQTELATATKLTRLKFVDSSNSGNFRLDNGVQLAWNYRIQSGLCAFEFEFWKLLFHWEVGLDAEAGFTLSASSAKTISKRATILKQGIPGAYLGTRIRLLGKVGIGFSVLLGYESDISIGMAAKYSASAKYQARQKVTMGLTYLNSQSLQKSGNGINHDLSFQESLSGRATASGFIGIRPGLAADVELLWFGAAGAELGATIGVEGRVQMATTPFDRYDGAAIGDCRSCHHVRGTLSLLGRRLSIRMYVGKRSSEVSIIERLFGLSKTACLFKTNCFYEPAGTGCSNSHCPASCS